MVVVAMGGVEERTDGDGGGGAAVCHTHQNMPDVFIGAIEGTEAGGGSSEQFVGNVNIIE